MNLIRKKSVRKAISTVTGLTMVVWMCGLGILAPMAGVLVADERPSVTVDGVTVYDGDLISSNATNEDGSPTYESLDIYIAKVVPNDPVETYKRLILNPSVFNSYGHLNWGDVTEVDQSVMDSFTTSDLARQDGTDEVYSLVADDDTGTKHWVNLTAEQFVDEAGADPDSIYTINSTDNGSYTTGAAYTDVQSFIDRTPPEATEAGTGLTVALASDTPAAATLPTGTSEGATGVVVTKFNVSASSDGDVTVQSIKTYRSGVGSASSISKVYLYEGDTRLTTGKTINTTTNQSTFTSLNYIVPAGTTKTLSIVIDLADAKTDNHAFGVNAASDITTNGATVSGTFPVVGNTMSLANLGTNAYGTVTTDRSGSASYTRKIGEKETIVGKFTVALSNENSELRRLSIYNSSNDVLDNMTLWRSSDKLADATENGRYFDFVLETPNKITKGETITYTLKADITSDNVSNTANLYIKNDADILIVGDTYGYGVDIDNTLYDGTDATEYSAVTLEAGDITITSSGPVATTVVVDQNDVVLMDVAITALNDTVIEQYGFDLTETGSIIANAEATDIEFTCEGIGAISTTSTVAATHTWTDFINLDAGVTYNCSLIIDLESTIDSGDTLLATIDISDWSFRDVNTDALFTSSSTTYNVIPTADQAGATMTVAAAGLTVAAATSPAAKTWVKGASDIEVAGYTFAADDADDILVQDITLTSCYGTAATSLSCGSHASNSASSVILSASLYDGVSPVGSAKSIDSSGTIAFTDLNWTVPAGTTKTLTVKANLNNSLPATTVYVTLGIEDGSITSYYDEGNKTLSGTDPDTDINTTASGSTGWDASSDIYQTVISTGTLAVDIPTTTPTTDIAVAGTTGVKFSEIKLSATREDFTVSKMALMDVNSAFDDNIAKIYVKYPTNGNGSTTETTECTLASGIVSCTGLNIFVPNPDTTGYNNYAIVEVLADMQTIAAGADAGDGPGFTVSFAGDFEALGASSGNKIYEQTVSVTDLTSNTNNAVETEALIAAAEATTTGTVLTIDNGSGAAITAGEIVAGDVLCITADDTSDCATDGDELVYVTAATTTSLTVIRGYAGSTAANIANNEYIYLVHTGSDRAATSPVQVSEAGTVMDVNDASTISATTTTVTVAGASALTTLAIGDVICVTPDTGTACVAGDEHLYVTAVNSATSISVTRGWDGTTAAVIADDEEVFLIRKSNGVLDTNAMNVQGTKLTLVAGTPAHGGQSTSEEVMEFTITADAVGDAEIRQGDVNEVTAATTDFNTAAFEGTFTATDALTFPATGGVGASASHARETSSGTDAASIIYTMTAADLSAYTGVCYWVRSSDATNTITLTLDDDDGTDQTVASGTLTADQWKFVCGDFTKGTGNDNINAVSTMTWAVTDSSAVSGATYDIDHVFLYKERVTIDLSLNADVNSQTPIGTNIAYLKQNGNIVAVGYTGWYDAVATSYGTLTFVPTGTYGDIEISGADTFTVEIDTTLFTDSTSTENLTSTIDLGNSSTAGDVSWYDVEGSDNVPYTGVNATDKISNTVSY